MNLAFEMNFGIKMRREAIYTTYPNAVQSACNLVAILVKFAAGMQLGQNHFNRGQFNLRMFIHWNTPPVIHNSLGPVFVDSLFDLIAVAGERLINRIINHFIDKMMQTTL